MAEPDAGWVWGYKNNHAHVIRCEEHSPDEDGTCTCDGCPIWHWVGDGPVPRKVQTWEWDTGELPGEVGDA